MIISHSPELGAGLAFDLDSLAGSFGRKKVFGFCGIS
jgi:hypothetical protein